MSGSIAFLIKKRKIERKKKKKKRRKTKDVNRRKEIPKHKLKINYEKNKKTTK